MAHEHQIHRRFLPMVAVGLLLLGGCETVKQVGQGAVDLTKNGWNAMTGNNPAPAPAYAPGNPAQAGYVSGQPGMNQPPAQEEVPTVRAMGQRMAGAVERAFGGRYESPAITRYVGEVGQSVVRSAGAGSMSFSFIVMKSDAVNHYSVPTDVNQANVYITLGLLRDLRNEAQLASVIAQEVACIQRHFLLDRMQAEVARYEAEQQKRKLVEVGTVIADVATRNKTNGAGALLAHAILTAATDMVVDPNRPDKVKGYGVPPEQIYAADADAIKFVSAAQYRPTQYRSYLETMLTLSQSDPLIKNNLMETHPINNDRVSKAEQVLAGMKDDASKGREEAGQYKENVLTALVAKPAAT